MIIDWQTINAARRPGGKFSRGFLVVAPGTAIRDRLRVLQPNDPESYYRHREIMAPDMLGEIDKAKIVTVIMLLFPWLLTGVVIVEVMFRYQGFGQALVDAAGNNDVDLLLACSIVSVTLVLLTQLISDVGYAWLNPRIRVH